MPEYRDEERCRQCGGKCCQIYLSCYDGGTWPSDQVWFEDWCMDWKHEFKVSGALDYLPPLFDPLLAFLDGNDAYLEKILRAGIDPRYCQYWSRTGCRLPWEKRPQVCREFRCQEWEQEEKTLSMH